MKELLSNIFAPAFNPTAQTLDFSLLPGFQASEIFAIINVTRNTPIYIPGVSGYGISSIAGSKITLQFNTSVHSTSDVINVYYDTKTSIYTANYAAENNGNLLQNTQLLTNIYKELRLLNIQLAQGFHIDLNEIIQISNDMDQESNLPSL